MSALERSIRFSCGHEDILAKYPLGSMGGVVSGLFPGKSIPTRVCCKKCLIRDFPSMLTGLTSKQINKKIGKSVAEDMYNHLPAAFGSSNEAHELPLPSKSVCMSTRMLAMLALGEEPKAEKSRTTIDDTKQDLLEEQWAHVLSSIRRRDSQADSSSEFASRTNSLYETSFHDIGKVRSFSLAESTLSDVASRKDSLYETSWDDVGKMRTFSLAESTTSDDVGKLMSFSLADPSTDAVEEFAGFTMT